MHQTQGCVFDYDFEAEDVVQKLPIIEDWVDYKTPEGNMDVFKSCTERAESYNYRDDMRKSLESEVGGELGKYLAKLDRLLASKKGRFLVDSINAVF